MKCQSIIVYVLTLVMYPACIPLYADVASDHGLDALIERVGAGNEPTGATIPVAQVEAASTSGDYAPDENDSAFVDTTFILRSGASGILNHATQVGKRIYGSNAVGIAPNIPTVHVYNAEGFILNDFLRTGTGNNPVTPPSGVKIYNNSWIGTFGSITNDTQCLARGDWSVDSHNLLLINGVANNADANPLMGYGYNSVSVGKQNGEHAFAPVPSGYAGAGRQIPLIVANQNTTSNATGIVSAACALLSEIRDTHPNTKNNYLATLSETTKAVLLGGGNHLVGWTNNPVISGASRGKTSQPIDEVVGVGTVNVDNIYRIMTGGQHASSTLWQNSKVAPSAAWETAAISANQSRYLRFEVPQLAESVSILTTWHQKPNAAFSSYTIYNIDMELWRVEGGALQSLVGPGGLKVFSSGNVVSESDVDNVEHLYIENLSPGEYVLEVKRVDSFSGSRVFSTSWLFPEADGITGDLDGDGIVGVEDLLIVISQWGTCSGCVADIEGNGVVDIEDLLIVIANWG